MPRGCNLQAIGLVAFAGRSRVGRFEAVPGLQLAARTGTGLVGCARVPGEERSEGDADRFARASIAPQHTCSVAMLLDPCTYTGDPSLLTSPLE
eukprot:scaffold18625_cov53-Phaeocystis_antarctica.AAC.2